jgi:adenylate kinase
MDAGQLVPDEVVFGLVEERLARPDAREGAILDGFPRTIPQAEALDALFTKMKRDPVRAVAIEVPESELLERLGGRRSCPKDGASYHVKFTPPKKPGVCDQCGSELITRADDRPVAIKKRLEEYHEKTSPLIEHYRKRDALRRVDGVGALEAILDRIAHAVA